MSAPQEAPQISLVDVVASNIRAEASRAGLNQTDLARVLGVSSVTVSKRWYGGRQWQLDELDAIADALGCEPADLMQNMQSPRRWIAPMGTAARLEGLEPPTFWLAPNADVTCDNVIDLAAARARRVA